MFWKIAAAIFLACLLTVTLLTALLLLEARAAVRSVNDAIQQTNSSVQATMKEVQGAAVEARQAVAKLNAATDAETAKLQATTEEARKTERSFRAGIDSLRQVAIDIHQQVIPQVALAVAHADANQTRITGAVVQSIDNLQPALENLSRASAAAAEQMGNPRIAEAIAHADEVSTNVAAATQSLAGVAANAKTASDLALERLRAALKPVPFARALLEKLFGLATQGAQLYYGTH